MYVLEDANWAELYAAEPEMISRNDGNVYEEAYVLYLDDLDYYRCLYQQEHQDDDYEKDLIEVQLVKLLENWLEQARQSLEAS